ncbi:DUF4271 domain-containing protein [uncultured Alistipes sp.]|uniref:DUF4271 domain-containing protein n=1 Tax=uncultured Alistipes sp. TaxID=538949 RepID=UPI00260D48B8|nr:DUF4271 domain-containing protein [uncultured Alistipes sp.]
MPDTVTYLRPAAVADSVAGTAGGAVAGSAAAPAAGRPAVRPAASAVRPAADSTSSASLVPAPADSAAAGASALACDTLAPLGRAFSFDPAADPAADARAAWRTVDAAELYGAQSAAVAAPGPRVGERASLVRNAAFEGAVLLLAGLYVMLLYRHLGDVRSLLSRISRDTASVERLAEDPGRSGFGRFLRVAAAIGLLFAGIAVVKGADELVPPHRAAALAPMAVAALPGLATLLCALVAGFRIAALRIAGAVTRTQPFVGQLLLVGRIYFALAVLFAVPLVTLYALCPRGGGSLWLCLAAGALAVTSMLYLRESLHLFIGKKISILHWFLYLCAVEIFPVSFVWLLLAGSSQ